MNRHSTMRALTTVESSIVGAVSGIIEVLLQQPSVNIKNSIQDNKPVVWNPRLLYRGVAVNAGSMAPISAIQFGVNTALETSMRGPFTAIDKTLIAMAAGAVSAIASSPAEVIMIQQQRSGLSIRAQIGYLTHHHGVLTLARGFTPCLVREAMYTAAYLGVNPILQAELMKSQNETVKQPMVAMMLASCVSGSSAAFITHPLDTIKTRMQANVDKIIYRTVRSTVKTIVEEGGVKALYSGLIPRTQRIVFAVFILGEMLEAGLSESKSRIPMSARESLTFNLTARIYRFTF